MCCFRASKFAPEGQFRLQLASFLRTIRRDWATVLGIKWHYWFFKWILKYLIIEPCRSHGKSRHAYPRARTSLSSSYCMLHVSYLHFSHIISLPHLENLWLKIATYRRGILDLRLGQTRIHVAHAPVVEIERQKYLAMRHALRLAAVSKEHSETIFHSSLTTVSQTSFHLFLYYIRA